MPSPVTPNQILETVPSPSGGFCSKFIKSLSLPKLVWQIVSYMFTEDGKLKTGAGSFGADVCALDCFGGDSGTGDGTFGKPLNVSASDGTYTDKVRVTWSSVTGATSYDVYRHTTNNSGTSTLIGSSTSTQFDDLTAESGINYFYWVRAKSTTQTSGYSDSDTGYKAASLTASSTLEASKGFSDGSDPFISLVFEPVAGATEYDFYISDTNDFAAAILLDSSRTPFDNSESQDLCNITPCTKPTFIDNGDELVYIYQPTDAADFFSKKYFWVVGKTRADGIITSMSAESNSAEGWAIGPGNGIQPLADASLFSGDADETMPAGAVSAWIALYGSGGGGAGGDGDNGGGGGGGGAMIVGWIPVVAGSKLRVASTPESDTDNAAKATDGDDGPVTKVQYSADGSFTDTVDVMTADAATGGEFLNGGNGAGGSGASGSADGSVIDLHIYDGRDGKPANGTKGGRGGHRFGGIRRQGAHWNGFFVGNDDGNGNVRGAGGGSYAYALVPDLCTGGKGMCGYALVIIYSV